ncbi:MAG: uncharacterized protein JWM10_4725 [Myxococcaceae bacterium]|nr:uncharacterized protein [Myxococcaceae bacterium]
MTDGPEEFRRVGAQLGLALSPADPAPFDTRFALDGLVDGVRVHVAQWIAQSVHVDFAAFLDPPADLRLSVRPAGLASRLGELLGRHDIPTGDAAFDAALDVHADEPARAQALLTPPVRAALLAWARSGARFELTDEGVSLYVIPGTYSTLDVADIVANVRAAAALAARVDEALRGVPSSARLAPDIAAWRAYAGAHALAFSASPLRATGVLHGAHLTARAVATDGGAYGVELRLRFEAPLSWVLRVRPARFFDFLERTGDASPAATGDADFDREFRVTTTDPARTRALLDADVRAALVALHRGDGAVVLDADGLAVRTAAMTDPAGFGAIVDRVAVVAQKLQRRAAPYRGGA